MIEKICNDNDDNNKNDDLSNINNEVNRAVFVLYFFIKKF